MGKLAILLLLAMAAAGCGEKEGELAACTCLSAYGTTAHLGMDETCKCGGKGCNCTAKVYGNIVNIPIYREATVTDTQATASESNIQLGYTGMDPTDKGNINASTVSAICITASTTSCELDSNGKYIIRIKQGVPDTAITSVLETFAYDYLSE